MTRVLVAHGPRGLLPAQRLLAALAPMGIEARLAPALTRDEIDGCELLVILFDARAPLWIEQAAGYALGRDRVVLPVARAPRDAALLAGIDPAPWPASRRVALALAERIRAALPATPRAAARSLADASPARWSREMRAEVDAELAARGWSRETLAGAMERGRRVFGEAAPGDVWWKEVAGERVWLRPRVAPFNPVDLLHVRERCASRVHEWWVLRDARSDAWMRRVYRGEQARVTRATKFFGVLARPPPRPGASVLVERRLLTQRVERTGALGGELAAIEAWLAAAGRKDPASALAPLASSPA